jgi:DNA end-binding protein Ku
MAPKANWKGYLKLSLVSCPVALFPATSSSEKISFHLLNSKTGNRLKQQYIDAETSEIVDRDDRVKGYQIAKADYVVVKDEELEKIEIESTHTIDIDSFVPRAEIDPVYFENHYYIAPDDKIGEEAFTVIREAMRVRDVVGIARVVLYGKERLVVLQPRGKGILGTTLHYQYEVRGDPAYFEDIPEIELSKEMLDLALHIIDMKKSDFDPARYKDRYQEAVAELIRSKRVGRPTEVPHAPAPSNVVNLMDALRRSLGAESGARAERKDAENKDQEKSTSRSGAHPTQGKTNRKAAGSASAGGRKSPARGRSKRAS